MPFGLGSIGGFLGGLGKQIGGGIKTGVRKLGEMRDEMDGQMDDGAPSPTFRRPMPMTPGWNPDAPMPNLGGARMQTMEMPHSQRPPSLERLSSPEQTMPQGSPRPMLPFSGAGHPPLTDFDQERGQMNNTLPTIRDSVNITDNIPQGGVSVSPHGDLGPIAQRRMPAGLGPRAVPMTPDLTAPQMSAPRDASFDRREDVPIPGRPNRGGPVPYSDYEAGKYDSWASHAKRDAEGNFDPKGGTNRNWKSIFQNALLGAANNSQGGDLAQMLGGALGGGLGSTINPQAGYEQVFDAGHGRRMMDDQARRDTEMDRRRKQRMGDLQIENIESQIGSRQSQAETARINAERQRAVAESTIKYNQARAEAQMRGTPKAVDLYNPQTGQIESVNVYPDGRREVLGVSGGAMIRRDSLQSQAERDRLNRESREREGMLNRQSREGIAQLPARARTGANGIPAEAEAAFRRVDGLKKKAVDLFTRADKEQNEALRQQAYAALENYNAELEDFGASYGDYYETGMGGDQNKWGYAKEKPRAMGSGGQSSGGGPKARLSDLKKYLQ